MEPLCYEQVDVGDSWTSQGRTVSEADIVGFAGLTGDYNPLHVDHEYSRQGPFRRPVAHGLLGLSLVAGLSSHAPLMNTLAFVSIEKWEFQRPTFIGDTVHVLTEVVEKRPSGRRGGLVVWKRSLVNQDGRVVQSGIFHTLVARQPGDES